MSCDGISLLVRNGGGRMDLKIFDKLSRTKIIVIGDVMLDRYIWGKVERISPEAPVPVVRALKKTYSLGGAANVANNLKGLGSNPILIGVKGTDTKGKLLSDLLAEKGIVSELLTISERPTTTKTRIMAQHQQLLRIDEEETNALTTEQEDKIFNICQKNLSKCHAVILSDYGKGVLKGELCKRIIALTRSHSIPVLVDPKGTNWIRYKGATCITPNEKEFAQFTGKPFRDKEELKQHALDTIQKLDLEYLLVTRGAKGMFLIGKDGNNYTIHAKAKEVFDVSGAGDTVIATLTACVAAGENWISAAKIANITAGIVVGKLGTQPIEKQELKEIVV